MPGHEGAVPGSRYRRWRVPWVGRTRAVAPCLLCEVLAVILVLRSGVALAWLLLRDCGSLGPRFLLPGLWWRCRSGLARSCSPGRFPASVLVPGPWAGLPRLSPSIRLLPLGRFDWWFLGSVSTSLEMAFLFFHGLVVAHFLGISRSDSVAFDSFSSSSSLHLLARALPEERVGVLVWVFIHQPPCLLILQHGSQVGHTGSPSLLSYNLLFILQVSILSEQMVFCVS